MLVKITDNRFQCYRAMIRRCHEPTNCMYPSYGAKGITVCDRWRDSFDVFCEDMGPRPDMTYTIERRKNHLGYTPDNCYWATKQQQSLNRRWFTRPGRTSATPHIIYERRCKSSWRVRLKITANDYFTDTRSTLEEAEELRDICVFERDFLKLRGLTYD